MTQTKTLAMTLIGSLLVAACGGTGDQSTSDEEGGEDYSGSDNNSGGPDEDDAGADVLPTYPTQHPRIYVEKHRARLTAALTANTSAATRLRTVVDSWVAGTDVYAFQAW